MSGKSVMVYELKQFSKIHNRYLKSYYLFNQGEDAPDFLNKEIERRASNHVLSNAKPLKVEKKGFWSSLFGTQQEEVSAKKLAPEKNNFSFKFVKTVPGCNGAWDLEMITRGHPVHYSDDFDWFID